MRTHSIVLRNALCLRGIVVLLGLMLHGLQAAETYTDPPVVSPDGAKTIRWQFGPRGFGTEWHIALRQNGRVLYRRTLPDKLDVRYVTASWAPSSQAALLGENYKAGMDLTVLQIRHRRVKVTHFDLADRMADKEGRELPFQQAIQSDAPVERILWSSVRWRSATRCTMLYIMHGLGYEGEGDVTVYLRGKRPSLRTSHLRPLSDPKAFNAGD